MKRSPYGRSPESYLLGPDQEPDWKGKYRRAADERDEWQAKAYALEREIRMEFDDPSACTVPICLKERSEYSRTGLCADHMHTAWEDMREWHREQQFEIDKKRSPEPKQWVVYYIQMGERIKIGRSTNLRRRLQSFHALPEQLLAIEPGPFEREQERHRQFAEWRHAGTELFDVNKPLQEHIEACVGTFGDPKQYIEPSR